ncbi:PHD Zn-finger proteins [Phaffia rhodozyma]|uniref:PHD Zn-finger proteins n=1 Tax=Phaffia rhodozyma TaxID=264483 RepID=A0A0F7SFR0_PHARH|nr:PHD Zn-finger proteins [Phaffia rhodozyma]
MAASPPPQPRSTRSRPSLPPTILDDHQSNGSRDPDSPSASPSANALAHMYYTQSLDGLGKRDRRKKSMSESTAIKMDKESSLFPKEGGDIKPMKREADYPKSPLSKSDSKVKGNKLTPEVEEEDEGAEEDEEDYEEAEVTRCVCGITESDDMMISCDTCNVWQHGACVGIPTEEETPDEYFCEKCRPDLHVTLKKWMKSRGRGGIFLPPSASDLLRLKPPESTLPPNQSKRWTHDIAGLSPLEEDEDEQTPAHGARSGGRRSRAAKEGAKGKVAALIGKESSSSTSTSNGTEKPTVSHRRKSSVTTVSTPTAVAAATSTTATVLAHSTPAETSVDLTTSSHNKPLSKHSSGKPSSSNMTAHPSQSASGIPPTPSPMPPGSQVDPPTPHSASKGQAPISSSSSSHPSHHKRTPSNPSAVPRRSPSANSQSPPHGPSAKGEKGRRSSPKRRSTMNSRPDAEYEKAIRASLIESGLIPEEEDSVRSPSPTSSTRHRRSFPGEDDLSGGADEGGLVPGVGIGIKRPRQGSDDLTSSGGNGAGVRKGKKVKKENEQGLESASLDAMLSSSYPHSANSASENNHSIGPSGRTVTTKHPNQYTYRPKPTSSSNNPVGSLRFKGLSSNSTPGEPGYDDHLRRSPPIGSSAHWNEDWAAGGDVRGLNSVSSVAAEWDPSIPGPSSGPNDPLPPPAQQLAPPAPPSPASVAAAAAAALRNSTILAWGVPDHLSHLTHLLPSPAPQPLVIRSSLNPSGSGTATAVPSSAGNTSGARGKRTSGAAGLRGADGEREEAPSKIRWPGRRMTLGEMRKRARGVLDYVGRWPVDTTAAAAAAAVLSSSSNGGSSSSSSTSSPSITVATTLLVSEPTVTFDIATDPSTLPITSETTSPLALLGNIDPSIPTLSTTTNGSTESEVEPEPVRVKTRSEEIEELIRDLIAFEQRFGVTATAALKDSSMSSSSLMVGLGGQGAVGGGSGAGNNGGERRKTSSGGSKSRSASVISDKGREREKEKEGSGSVGSKTPGVEGDQGDGRELESTDAQQAV